ncbi:TPR domain protein [Talaromyces stipitatus ATCC 10500]|uniref:TPR domain protein n=1 Tax=Talaromyces stipitatus (strain ATCC 10500 / CBS 375.48 / QM 6759 / NRRL 1006) TaxID=441959 RepID=B8MJ17_TALSN|nr:TPR domain protein [Talaromyces stipitatus ATCC 10500]EED15679.1 TPR domain protein [Talaromyces stipitatus ATCC 10500]
MDLTPVKPDNYFDLGSYHRPVTTDSESAQIWFNRGLIWTFGFNHEEAVTCFKNAIRDDPKCAIAYWGLAYAIGPNYNKPWDTFDGKDLHTSLREAHRAAIHAKNVAVDSVTSAERALIDAITHRYPTETIENIENERNERIFAGWNLGYAESMGIAYRNHTDDLDIAALYADALMNLTPWKLWDLKTGQPNPGSRAPEVKRVLEHAISLDGDLQHPGILHMYIHLMEMSTTPERALVIADHLRGLVPDAGHLNHMPSHLDILCGDYRQAVQSNTRAIQADEKYFATTGSLRFYTVYRVHDFHFRLYAAMFAGQSRVALDTVEELERSIPEQLLRVESPPMADWLEGFMAMRVHALIRFGRWEEILTLKLPIDQTLYTVTTTMLHYAKGVANAALGNVHDAERERELFKQSLMHVQPSRMLFNNSCLHILQVADAMLNGEIEYRKNNFDQAFAHLRDAIKLDQELPYDEPWGWMQPPRHAYGALLLEQGHFEEALDVYTTDLGFNDVLPRAMQHPNNVWSLHGLVECLITLERDDEARLLKKQLDLAVAVADNATEDFNLISARI